jgi:hypothetical protein
MVTVALLILAGIVAWTAIGAVWWFVIKGFPRRPR